MAIESQKPPKDKSKSKSGKSSNSQSQRSKTDEAWTLNQETGQRERTGKLLPFESRIRETLTAVSGGVLMLGDEFVANAITVQSEELAYGWAKLGQADPRVKKALEIIFTGSAYTEALIPTVSLAVMVGWHYGMIPDRLGVPLVMANQLTPMSREVEAEMRQQQRDAAQSNSQGENDTSGD